MAKTYSGREVIRALVRIFNFIIISQKGSHVKLRKQVGKKMITTIVPLHKELARGTLRGILKLAEIDEAEFRKQF